LLNWDFVERGRRGSNPRPPDRQKPQNLRQQLPFWFSRELLIRCPRQSLVSADAGGWMFLNWLMLMLFYLVLVVPMFWVLSPVQKAPI